MCSSRAALGWFRDFLLAVENPEGQFVPFKMLLTIALRDTLPDEGREQLKVKRVERNEGGSRTVSHAGLKIVR